MSINATGVVSGVRRSSLVLPSWEPFFRLLNGYNPEDPKKPKILSVSEPVKAVWWLHPLFQTVGLVNDKFAKFARAFYGTFWSLFYSCKRPGKDGRELLIDEGAPKPISSSVKNLYKANEYFRIFGGLTVSVGYITGALGMLWGALTGKDEAYEKWGNIYQTWMLNQNTIFSSMDGRESALRVLNPSQAEAAHRNGKNIKAKVELTNAILFPLHLITRALDTCRSFGMELSEGLQRFTNSIGFLGYGLWTSRFGLVKGIQEAGGDLEPLNLNLKGKAKKIDEFLYYTQKYSSVFFSTFLTGLSWLAGVGELLGLRNFAQNAFKLEGIVERCSPVIAAYAFRSTWLKWFGKEEKAQVPPIVQPVAQQVQADVQAPAEVIPGVVRKAEADKVHITRTISKTPKHLHVMHMKYSMFQPEGFRNFIDDAQKELGEDENFITYEKIPCGNRCSTIIRNRLKEGEHVIVDPLSVSVEDVVVSPQLGIQELSRLLVFKNPNLVSELISNPKIAAIRQLIAGKLSEDFEIKKAWQDLLELAKEQRIKWSSVLTACKNGQINYEMVRDSSNLFPKNKSVWDDAFDAAYMAELEKNQIPSVTKTPTSSTITVTNTEQIRSEAQLSKKDEEPVIIPFNKQIHRSMISLRKGEQNGDISELTFDHLLVAAKKGWINWAHFIKIATQERFWDDFIKAVESEQISCNVIQDNESEFPDKNKFYEAEDTALMIEAGQYSAKRGKAYKVQLAAV